MDTDEMLEQIGMTAALANGAATDAAQWAIEAVASTHTAQAELRRQVDELLAAKGLTPSTGTGMIPYVPPPGSEGAVAFSAGVPTADDTAVDAAYAESEIGRLSLGSKFIDPRKISTNTSEVAMTGDRLFSDGDVLHLTAEQAAEDRGAVVARLAAEQVALARKGSKRHQHGADLEHDLDEDENASDDSQPGKGGVDAVAARHGLYFGHGGPEKPQSGNRRGTRPSKSSFGQRERTLAR